MRGDQLGLLLWKNFIVRKRQPGILALVFLWPVCVFMILYTVRDNIDPEHHPTCQFPARLMPQDGLLPFVQSYICSVGNPCDSLSEYEEVPTYKNATLGPLLVELQPMLRNKTILSAIETLPKSIQLLKSMAEILTRPEIKALFDRGIRLGDLFNNHDEIKSYLKAQLPNAREGLVDGLFESSIRLYYLIETFGSSNVDGVICSPEMLQKYLIVPREEDLNEVSKVLCEIDSKSIPDILKHLSKHLDFSGLLAMVDRAMAKFRDYDFFQDLKTAVETILNLKTVQKYVPDYLQINDWMPKIILLFKNVTFKQIDTTFINKSLEILDPIFNKQRDWTIARRGFLNLNTLLEMVKDLVGNRTTGTTEDDFFSLMERLQRTVRGLTLSELNKDNVTQVLDVAFLVLQDGIKLTAKILDRHVDDLQLAANIFDGLRDTFSEGIVNSVTYFVSVIENIVRITHHVAYLHEDLFRKTYEICLKHREVVEKLLSTLDPNVYRQIIVSFSRLNFLLDLVDLVADKKVEEVICEKDKLNEIFDNFVNSTLDYDTTSSILCSDSGKRFISDVYDNLELGEFEETLEHVLSAFLSTALKNPVRIQTTNLTSLVFHMKSFVQYLEAPKEKTPDWSIFKPNQEWTAAFEETLPQARLNVLAIHLCLAQQLGSRKLSYITIKPDLENMDMIARMILLDLRANPTSWIGEVRRHEPELIESFYLTVTDREKTLKILEYDNFTRTYCTDSNPTPLLNFPKGSNETLLKDLVCHLSKSVQTNLELNVTHTPDFQAAYRRHFNWTAFNEKTIEIYKYIDTLLHQEDNHISVSRINELKAYFKESWNVNATAADVWEISVGVLCKIFSLMESPLFEIQLKPNWKSMYAIAWASSVIFDNIEKIIDQIQKNVHVATLSEILEDLPQTEILIDVILRNLSPAVLDIVDIVTMKVPVNMAQTIDEYKSRESEWPCVHSESVGSALKLRTGSQAIVREIERLACNPGLITKEWTEQPVLMRVRKIFQHDDTVQLPPFNWTLGYTKFRRLVTKFDALVSDTMGVILKDNPTLPADMENLGPEVQGIVNSRFPMIRNESIRISDYIDLELDKAIEIFRSNRSAREIWNPRVNETERLLILTKFMSHFVHETSAMALNILGDGSGNITLLSLLGFHEKSPITIFYNRLPYIMSTLLIGLSDPMLAFKITRFVERGGTVTCSMVFDWWSDYKIGITEEEYRILQNFTCDLDPENFNAYADVFLSERITWRKPVKEYRPYVATSIGDLYDLGKKITQTMRNNITIVQPFSKKYMRSVLYTLRDTLELRSGEVYKDIHTDWIWGPFKVMLEAMSEALLHVAEALQSAEVKNNELATWQLVKNSDVRQLLKLLELHPEETIALVAQLTKIDPKTKDLIEFRDLRNVMCNEHFGSDYWITPNRTRFLQEVCSFDPFQLLKTITSEEIYNIIAGHTDNLQTKTTPAILSVTTFLDVLLNLTKSTPDLRLRSNIFNATTWKSLSNDTWSLIRDVEQTWAEEIVIYAEKYHPASANRNNNGGDRSHETFHLINDIARLFELLEFVTDVFSGGDIWQKLRVTYESLKMKPFLTLVEDMPNLVITAVDTFVTSERISDFIEKLYFGQVHPCDIDKYLIPPNFMRKKGLLSSITNFCQKIVMSDREFTLLDLLPVDPRIEENRAVYSVARGAAQQLDPMNKTYFVQKVTHFQTTVIRVFDEGYKEPKVPTWWTSFEEGTLKDFVNQYKAKDLRALAHSVVKKAANLVRDLFNKSPFDKNCSWCTTFLIEIVNTQLSHHNLYSKLLCQLNRLEMSELHDILMHDFYWNKTISMIKNYKFLNTKKTINEFVSTLEITMHYVADIIVDFQNATYADKVRQCFYKYIGGRTYSRPGLYISLLIGALDALKENVNLIDTASNHQDILRLTQLAELNVPIWKPLRDVVKKTDVNTIDKLLPNATINVNAIMNDRNHSLCRTKDECRNSTLLYNFLSSKRASKVFRYDPKLSKYPTLQKISTQLADSLDLNLTRREIFTWRQEAAWDLTWIKEILRHLIVVLNEGGNLLDVASKIDFEDVSNLLGVPDLADGVVNILKDKTVDKLFAGLKEILEDVEPLVADPEVLQDLYSMVVALESMEIFKNLGLLDMKYKISDMFDNWDVVRQYLVDKINISNEMTQILSQAKIDMISVFLKERNAISLKDTVCSPEKLGHMLNFDQGGVTAEEVSPALCQLNDSQTQNVTITLMKNLNFEYIFKNLMSANVKNILANANMTEAEGKIVLDNLGVASELLPFFKERLSAGFSSNVTEETTEIESDEPISSSKFLQDSSEMLCGRALVSDSSQFYKIISSIEDNSKAFDQNELESLPTDFCRDTYKSMVKMGGGKIIWTYIKPLLRGQILYAPNVTSVSKIMELANDTFIQMENFGILLNSFEKTLTSLASLTEMGDSLRELQDVMSSDVMKIAIKSFGGGNFEAGDFSELNLSEIAWRLNKSKRLITMVGMLNDLMGCVLVDRVKGFSDEEELEANARHLMGSNEFLAAVVFLDSEKSGRTKRSLNNELPDNVTYKIRMDVDYVPSTRRLKTQFWIPGPEGSFIEDLRYLRGFIQLQDSVDRAIIKVKSQKELSWKTLTQQMPYPCWKYAPFQTTLYESQGVQVCFFFALMMCVGSAVRHFVWERESQNSMVMSVMGLKPWRNTFAWFITSFVELAIVMVSIGLILLAGKILPRSDPSLVLLLFFDYIFSIVTFCYMISTMFSSASLAAVTTVVMFLLTYMPYVIVIAMEAVFGLGFKLFICLSMSTSFCYGCLYAVRKEVQGTGLTWGSMWEESSPGDPMSLGLVLLMITFDGCMYALIGYLVTRYTNSGRDFHGLRSRSLWWADTRSLYGRPSYLAFVNNLYFTNDVLHPSTTYQEDDSDVSSLTVSEKQIGVRFENVRKVYHTERGDVVAVDDFTLKLCEGEVTSLLGRNGAGKTTIIKMLTGMLAPTSGEICLNGEEGCKPDIGVCPQDNVLIGTLTPREHMVFYSKLKRSSDNLDMQRSVNDMLASLELGRQEHEPVCRLSGGTKRRLCVALAFLGSPKLVILDEPGAGVDPAARRRIWRLIDQHRIGRTVILSTHHLDEADMLSDTVVVMHKGKILCTGSPLTLKMTHGRGYRMNVSFTTEQGSASDSIERKSLETLRTVIEDVVPNAIMNEVSGSEVVVTLPYQKKHGANNDIAQVAKALEDNRKLVGFSHFSLECDTLERVFLDLCARADNGLTDVRTSQDSVATVDQIGLSIPNDDIDLLDIEPLPRPSPLRQVKALLRKRLWHFARDWRSPLAALILPTMFVAVAMGFSLIRPPSEDEPPLVLTPKLYDTRPTYFYSIDNGSDAFSQHISLQLHDRFGDDYAGAWQTLPNDTGTCECTDGQQRCHGVSQAVEGLLQTLPGRPTLDWIVSTHQEYIEKRYGGWSLSHYKNESLFVVWYNNKGHHALPSYLNALNEAILRASGVRGHLTTLNHPLKLSHDQLNRTTLLQHVADVGIALVLLVAFSLVGAQGARELVRERLSEEKRILYLAGVHPITYWTTALIWDFIVFGCSIALAVVVFEIFGLSAYVSKDNLPGVCLLLFLFAWAAIPFSHLAEKAFDDSSLSNMVLFCVNTFIGVASLATILVIDILGKTKTAEEARVILHRILMIFPQYVLGDALVQLSRNDITAELLRQFHMDTYQSPLGWDLLGLHYVFLVIVGAFLFGLNLVIECRLLPDLKKQRPNYEIVQEDEDVARERMRVESGHGDDTLQAVKLRKEYRSVYGTNVAVQNLSLGVQAGKCFGLLGVNGAGKSTTFKMLTTEVIPTAGKILLTGKEIGAGPLCNGEIGYCPQSDALDGFLTPYQCLTIHGEVCGLSNVPNAVDTMLRLFDLGKYAHQRVSSLSGGNKRKLCAAISVMSPVSVVLMDEPTSGMDPATKDLVARAIRRVTKNQSCVILTSHSVAECESLCNRVGILAKAGLRCIGTPQHLKHKFGEGYVAFLRFGQPVQPADLRKAIAKHLPQAVISSRQATAARLLVPRSQDMALSTSFSKVKLLAEELKATDYTLTQSSLDQVLVNFSEELEDEIIDVSGYGQASRNSLPNMYSSMDTIHMETF